MALPEHWNSFHGVGKGGSRIPIKSISPFLWKFLDPLLGEGVARVCEYQYSVIWCVWVNILLKYELILLDTIFWYLTSGDPFVLNISMVRYSFFCSPELKAQVRFSDFLTSVCLSVHLSINFTHFHLLLQNHLANFNQTWHKASLVVWRKFFIQMKGHAFV